MHDHDHHHHHHHEFASVTRAFYFGIALNISYVVIEAAAGFWWNSLSLVSDALHNLSDVGSLVLVVVANRLAQQKATTQYTYGFGKSTILAALINAFGLMLMVGWIGWEAVDRMMSPHEVNGIGMAGLAGIGILINGATAWFFLREKDKDINVKSAYLHMVADALVSAGVVVSGILIYFTGWYWLDPVVSAGIAIVILVGSWQLLRDSWRLSMDGVPSDVNVDSIRQFLLSLKGVTSLHDLHVWALSTRATALTVHLVVPAEDEGLIAHAKEELHRRFNIDHTTIQIETTAGKQCHQHC